MSHASGRRGVALTPMETRRDVIVRTAVLADKLGYEIFAVPEGWGLDSAPVLTEIAVRTTSIRLVSGILSVWGRTPATLAMTAATLHQVSGGRYLLGLGASTKALVEGFHDIPFEHPAAKLRDVVIKVRALLAGQPAQLGHAPAARPLRLGQPPAAEIPIWIAALGQHTTRVAAELGDGWIPALVARDRLRAWAAQLNAQREGAAPHARPLTVAAGPIAAADENADVARDIAASCTAWYLSAMGEVYARSLSGQGYADQVQAIISANPRPSPRRATIPPGAQIVLDQLAACGTRGQVRQQLQLWDQAADIVVILLPPGMPWPTIEATLLAAAPCAQEESRLPLTTEEEPEEEAASSTGCTQLHPTGDGIAVSKDDNVRVTARNVRWLRDRARRVVAFLVRSEPRRSLSGWSLAVDAVIAAAATSGAIAEVVTRHRSIITPSGTVFYPVTVHPPGLHKTIVYAAVSGGQLIGFSRYLPQNLPPLPQPSVTALILIALTAAPLALRRRYPIASCCVILGAIIAIRGYDDTPAITFATAVFAAYSAVVYSRFRQLAICLVLIGVAIITAMFPNTMPEVSERYMAVLVAIPTVAAGIGMRQWRQRAGDSAERLRRAQAEHEAATRRALAMERSRIASELHDVVTHNVSVMVVQAGAARQVLASSPHDAREALLAVEASGRTAMAELRHLLGLLCPVSPGPGTGDVEAADADAVLRPQPGLGQLSSLIDRVSAAGLPVELRIDGTERDLPPGLDLAAYRVVQEALTNVIKHAGRAPTSVRIDYRPRELRIEVADEGRDPGDLGPGGPPAGEPGIERGLIGLRERITIYGGTLDAGPRPGGGWRLRARIPLYATSGGEPDGLLPGLDTATA
jgi:alkanesulfonate monooxygenase SsuD/methylene tetrahydromethanopterin reductase-like flavin-dependent oxidoreductase (luciferase family)/signal transduction histidine kinase